MNENKILGMDLDTLSALSKLDFSEDEKVVLDAELRAFFHMAEKLNTIEVDGVDTETADCAVNVFRADMVEENSCVAEILDCVKTKEDRYINVPIVVEG